MMYVADDDERLLNIREVAQRVGMSVRTVERLVKHGKFPPPVHPSLGRNAWLVSALVQWMRSLQCGELPDYSKPSPIQ